MKVYAVNGSARREGNTKRLLSMVCAELETEGIETEIASLAGKQVGGCIGCGKCGEKKNRRCVFDNDPANLHIGKMDQADGILLGSPVYFSDMSANMKGLVERAGMVSRQNGYMFERKPGAPVVAVRRAGANHTIASINYFFLISSMIVVGSSYWNMAIGREAGEVEKDEEGVGIMRDLGKNMAWLLKKING
ncbi:MAG: flavodoxin family protein [Desulfatibacillaceae bacterium]